jgi:hypothetical protein
MLYVVFSDCSSRQKPLITFTEGFMLEKNILISAAIVHGLKSNS